MSIPPELEFADESVPGACPAACPEPVEGPLEGPVEGQEPPRPRPVRVVAWVVIVALVIAGGGSTILALAH
ncbi:MAG: hypothetical protein QM607_01710 [Microbacterium sp.]